MDPQSKTHSSSFNEVYIRLKAIQERTTFHKQHLSDFAPFLATNQPLYPDLHSTEHSLARNGIDQSCVDLHHLDLVICDIENILESARRTRIEITSSLTQFNALLHPVRSLPDDILLLVFQWCTDSHQCRSSRCRSSLDRRHPSWTITWVCRRWRHLALKSPPLWSVVNLSEYALRQHHEDVVLPRLDLQLQRSGSTPLAVIIDDDVSFSRHLNSRAKIFSLLRTTTNRWWYLRMGTLSSDADGDFHTFFAGRSFDNLTHLSVKDDPDSDVEGVPITAFRDAPRLTHVHSLGEYKMDLQWGNIEVYRTSVYCLAHHSRLSSLRKLTIDATKGFMRGLEIFGQQQLVQLPSLLTLILFFDDPMILNHLSMPCLETLHLRLPLYNPRAYPDLRQCSKHLRNLSITSGRMTNVNPLFSFLSGAPYVTALYLEDSLLLKTTFLRVNGTADDLFPLLESLRMDASELENDWAGLELEAIIESRLKAPAPRIRELVLIGPSKFEQPRRTPPSFPSFTICSDLKSFHISRMNNPENGVSSWPILATSTSTKTLNSLYDDVLTCILLFCSDSYVNDSLDSERYPWVLTHVCRRWRTLVLASPHFWSTIYLVFENYLDLRPADVVLRAKTFLQKSGNVTDLIVHIEEHLNGEVEDYEEKREPFVQSLIALLIPTTSRWRSVEISAFPDLYGRLSGCSFERLRTLELSPLAMDDDLLGVGDHITLFRDAVRLNELKLDGPWRGTIIIPCGGIKRFDTSSYGLRILPQMHDLRTLRIEDDACVIEVLDQILSELGSFVLPSLHDFIFCESTSNHFLYELSKLMRAPALERLEIVDTLQHVSRPRGPTRFPVFTDLDNLVRLVICFEPEEENDLTDFLSRVPSVATLHLCQNVATPATLRAIQMGVLPKLTTLSLSFRTMQMHAKSVISMLHARAQNSVGGPIGVVRFVRCTHNMYDWANDGWDEWKSNEALGLEETLRTKWLELREIIDVHFDHQVDF